MACKCAETFGSMEVNNLDVVAETDYPHIVVLNVNCLRCGEPIQMIVWDSEKKSLPTLAASATAHGGGLAVALE